MLRHIRRTYIPGLALLGLLVPAKANSASLDQEGKKDTGKKDTHFKGKNGQEGDALQRLLRRVERTKTHARRTRLPDQEQPRRTKGTDRIVIAVSRPHFSRPQAIATVRRSFLVELDAEGLVLPRQPIETGPIRSAGNEPMAPRWSSPLPRAGRTQPTARSAPHRGRIDSGQGAHGRNEMPVSSVACPVRC